MYTLIEIFDSKQYENIITPLSLSNISKIIYIGSVDVMTNDKQEKLSRFFELRKKNIPIEFCIVNKDDVLSIKTVLLEITKNNSEKIELPKKESIKTEEKTKTEQVKTPKIIPTKTEEKIITEQLDLPETTTTKQKKA